jgi:hypothetical protein
MELRMIWSLLLIRFLVQGKIQNEGEFSTVNAGWEHPFAVILFSIVQITRKS